MSQSIFVPLIDELLDRDPELLNTRLVPYSVNRPCYHWLAVELNPVDDTPKPVIAKSFCVSPLW